MVDEVPQPPQLAVGPHRVGDLVGQEGERRQLVHVGQQPVDGVVRPEVADDLVALAVHGGEQPVARPRRGAAPVAGGLVDDGLGRQEGTGFLRRGEDAAVALQRGHVQRGEHRGIELQGQQRRLGLAVAVGDDAHAPVVLDVEHERDLLEAEALVGGAAGLVERRLEVARARDGQQLGERDAVAPQVAGGPRGAQGLRGVARRGDQEVEGLVVGAQAVEGLVDGEHAEERLGLAERDEQHVVRVPGVGVLGHGGVRAPREHVQGRRARDEVGAPVLPALVEQLAEGGVGLAVAEQLGAGLVVAVHVDDLQLVPGGAQEVQRDDAEAEGLCHDARDGLHDLVDLAAVPEPRELEQGREAPRRGGGCSRRHGRGVGNQRPGLEHGVHPCGRPASSRACARTSSSIAGVSFPVNVFCWETWKEPSMSGPSGAVHSAP